METMLLGFPNLKSRLVSSGKPVILLEILQEVGPCVSPAFFLVQDLIPRAGTPVIPLYIPSRSSQRRTTGSSPNSISRASRRITLVRRGSMRPRWLRRGPGSADYGFEIDRRRRSWVCPFLPEGEVLLTRRGRGARGYLEIHGGRGEFATSEWFNEARLGC